MYIYVVMVILWSVEKRRELACGILRGVFASHDSAVDARDALPLECIEGSVLREGNLRGEDIVWLFGEDDTNVTGKYAWRIVETKATN